MPKVVTRESLFSRKMPEEVIREGLFQKFRVLFFTRESFFPESIQRLRNSFL